MKLCRTVDCGAEATRKGRCVPCYNRRTRERWAAGGPQVEKRKQLSRDYRAKNAERLRAYDRARPARGTPEKQREYSRKHWHESTGKEKGRLRRRNKKCGFTAELVASCREMQGDLCAICRQEFRAFRDGRSSECADHDHQTGVARGLLCYHCNVGLGHYEKRQSQTIRIEPYESYLSAPPAALVVVCP